MSALAVLGHVIPLVFAGYGLLSAFLSRIFVTGGVRSLASYLGVALLVGAGAAGVVLAGLAACGVRTTPAIVLITSLGLGIIGAGAGRWSARRRPAVPPMPEGSLRRRSSTVERLVATGAGCLVATWTALALYGSFRTAPWLDDTYTMWFAKGIALQTVGLDDRLFTMHQESIPFYRLDYPLWWSIHSSAASTLLGDVDVRTVVAETAVLVAAFIGAVARMLWDFVRPSILWASVLALLLSPSFVSAMRSGGADLPLALYVGAFLLASGIWLAKRDGLALCVAGICAATAVAIKSEGAPIIVLSGTLAGLLALHSRRREVFALLLTGIAALASALPGFLWRQLHDVHNAISFGDAVDPFHLAARSERVWPSVRALALESVDPGSWAPFAVVAVIASLLAVVIHKRLVWAAPGVILVVGIAFWTWTYWVDPFPLEIRVERATPRVILSVIVPLVVSLPLVLDRLLTACLTRTGRLS